MAITFGWVGTDYDNASYEAVTPAGSGGIIVAITAGNGGEPSPATPADWNELTISVGASEVYIWAGYWAIADNNPDMTFNKSGSGEAGIYTWRIPDADVTSPEVYVASLEATFTSTLAIAQPNRSSIKGDQVGLVGLQASGARTLDSTSAGWVEDKDGYIGIAEWWAGQAAAIHYEGYLADYGSATIGGGVLDTGSTAAIWVKAVENVIATDDFNRADGGLGSNWTTATFYAADAPQISGNQVTNNGSGSDAAAVYTGSTLAADQWAEADLNLGTSNGPAAGIWVRSKPGTAQGYEGNWTVDNGGTYAIYDIADGVVIGASATGVGTSGTRRFRLEAAGSQITLYVDGVEQVTVTDTSTSGAGGDTQAGIWVGNFSGTTGPYIDNFSAGDWTTASATAPSAISDLAATPGNAQVELTWTAPADGGSAITDYEYRVDGGTWTSIGSATPGYTVTSLTNGVSYDFEVRAVNAVGSAAASNLVSATPVAVSVPTLLDGTSSGSNTAANPQNVAYPAHNAGDLVVQSIAVDANVSPTIPATGPGGETIITIVDNVTPSTAGPHFSAWAFIANATRAAGDLSVSMSAIEQTSSEAFRVAAGDFDPTDPIPDISTAGLETNGTTGQMNMPSFTASVANGRVVMMGGVDADPMTATFSPAGWTDFIDHDVGAVSSCVAFRDAGTTVSETIAAATFGVNTGDTNSCIGFVIAPYTGAAPTYLLKLGDLSVTAMYLGDLAVSAAYLGDVQVL